MKYKGEVVSGVNVKECFIERSKHPEGGYKFLCRTVTSDDIKFMDKVLGPEPEAPTVTMAGGATKKDVNNEEFKKAKLDYDAKRSAGYVLCSLRETEDLEFEKVDMENPDTWTLWSEEMAEADITNAEMQKIVETVMLANNFSLEHLKVAQKDF